MFHTDRRGRIDGDHHDRRTVAPARAIPHNEGGETTASAVVLVPIVLFMIFAVVQVAVAWHAKSALEAAAEDGLRSVQSNRYADPVETAKASAQMNARFVDRLRVVSTQTGPGRVAVTVTGDVPGPIPGMRWTLSARASGPLDRFRTQGAP